MHGECDVQVEIEQIRRLDGNIWENSSSDVFSQDDVFEMILLVVFTCLFLSFPSPHAPRQPAAPPGEGCKPWSDRANEAEHASNTNRLAAGPESTQRKA